MMRLFFRLCVLVAISITTLKADEGMWLMQQLETRLAEMQARGLKLGAYDIYNPNGSALSDAVVIFDRGCTGELISSQGLVLTNHHCGYDAIRALSSVQDNYLEHGYWAQSIAQELPARGVTITSVEAIEDVTDYVKEQLRKEPSSSMAYLSPRYLATLAKKRVKHLPKGVEVEIKAFYNGNRYLMFTTKVYRDIRLVGTPPKSIGAYGADTDNWAYPRHSADFSLFRIYTDAQGNPADYSPSNVPLRPKRWLNISTKGIEEGDFAMIMGFPGRTNRFYLPDEVEEWKSVDNDIRIRMRAIRQDIMLREMLADPAINIKYAGKYATSQNAYKRAIGANWGIEVRKLGEAKRLQMQNLLAWAKPNEQAKYTEAIGVINHAIKQRRDLRTRLWYLNEGLLQSIDLIQALKYLDSPHELQHFYEDSYDAQVDQLITKAMLAEYCRVVAEEHWPKAIAYGVRQYGSVEAYVHQLYNSRYVSYARWQANKDQQESRADSLVKALAYSLKEEQELLSQQLAQYDEPIERARRTYVGGLLEQYGVDDLWPDANFTLRFTFGFIRGYEPRDGMRYHHQTYLDGVIEKEDPSRWEYTLSPKLKEIYKKQTYGHNNRWAVRSADGAWRMPVNFVATTHTTGGNSGSPVLNAKGQLIGINFDRNWEGVAGDIQYLPDYQRSIICDIRYILMIIEEFGACSRLLDEMTLVD